MDFETAIKIMIEQSLGECGESVQEMEVARAIVDGIIKLKKELYDAKNS